MSEFLQFGHPDADQIGAFVEHALPAHEREQMLGHLAVCPECRTMVALTLPATEEPMKPSALPARKSWFSGWNLAWPAAAAFATLAVIVLSLHHAAIVPNLPAPNQIASAHLPAPMVVPKTAPARINEPPTARSIQRGRPSASVDRAAPVSLPKKDEHATGAANALAVQTDSNVVSKLVNPEQIASVNVNKESAPSVESTSNVVSTLISSQEVSEIATENRNFSALAALGLGGSKNGEPELQSHPSKHRLPSRLAALSMAVHGSQMIVIDTHNAVFLSADAGKHWKTIRAPWTGRAVMVELASTEAAVFKNAIRDFSQKERSAPPASSPAPGQAPVRVPLFNPASTSEQLSSLTGIVTDQTGAIIAGATIRASNPVTGESRSVQSDPTGLYLIDGLAPGAYTLKVDARGFELYVQSSVPVTASAQTVVGVRLTLGAETQTVSVVADALTVQADSNVVSTLIEPDQPLPVFEITTDNRDHWTSADGINWKRK